MMLLNGRERWENNWKRLLADVDDRFHVVNITTPSGSALSVIEVEFR